MPLFLSVNLFSFFFLHFVVFLSPFGSDWSNRLGGHFIRLTFIAKTNLLAFNAFGWSLTMLRANEVRISLFPKPLNFNVKLQIFSSYQLSTH